MNDDNELSEDSVAAITPVTSSRYHLVGSDILEFIIPSKLVKNSVVCLAGSSLPAPATPKISTIRMHLNPSGIVPWNVLEMWLFERLGLRETSDHHWSEWCRHCEKRLEHVKHQLELDIVRDLFIQSLRILHSLDASSLADAYLQSDIDDAKLKQPTPEAHTTAVHALQHSSEYALFINISEQVMRAVMAISHQGGALMKRICEQKSCFFNSLLGQPVFSKVVRFETAWMQILLQDQRQDIGEQTWRADVNSIQDETVIRTLCLTKWQLQSLLLPGTNYALYLTYTQVRSFQITSRRIWTEDL